MVMPGIPPESNPVTRRRPLSGPSATRRAGERDRLFALRLDVFKRLYRWLNLTLIQQGVWPLLVVLAAAPSVPIGAAPSVRIEDLPGPWWLARVAGPTLATILAVLYLRMQPNPPGEDSVDGAAFGETLGSAGGGSFPLPIGWLLPLFAAMLAVARIAVGPWEPTAKFILFGLVNVAAFQTIHFGVVRRSWPAGATGTAVALALFAVSWGLGDVFAGVALGIPVDPSLTFLGGLAVGLAVALLSLAARRWLGGGWSGAAAHLIVVYLIFGFV